jgi:hypothetical protein
VIYTDSTFYLDATQVIKTSRINAFRFGKLALSSLALAIIAGSALAQEENPAADDNATSWRDSTIAQCTQQYSAEQCADSEFLEEHFHVKTLEIAHRAAMQRNKQEEKALHELTLQRVCSIPARANCANDAAAAECIVQIEQACAILKAEATNCVQNALLTCSHEDNPSACAKLRVSFCPSLKKQPIEQLLAKYPRLSSAQKAHLRATATELDAKLGSWWSNLIARLKMPFH